VKLILLRQAQDGSMNLAQALEERLRLINCTPDDVRRFVERYPPETRMTKVGSITSIWGGGGLLAKVGFANHALSARLGLPNWQ